MVYFGSIIKIKQMQNSAAIHLKKKIITINESKMPNSNK